MPPVNQASPHGEAPAPEQAIICFAAGTMIRTPLGERRIEHLAEGDLVLTVDSGPQAIRWTGSKTVRATGALAPVRFARGAIGNDRDLFVSPQHRMLVAGPDARRVSKQDEVLAPALALVDDYRVIVAYGGMVTYLHMMFDRHQVVIANGAPSESFHPGGFGLDTLDPQARAGLFQVFPGLRTDIAAYGGPSRSCLSASDARVLRAG